jgi:hypothetical protein
MKMLYFIFPLLIICLFYLELVLQMFFDLWISLKDTLYKFTLCHEEQSSFLAINNN